MCVYIRVWYFARVFFSVRVRLFFPEIKMFVRSAKKKKPKQPPITTRKFKQRKTKSITTQCVLVVAERTKQKK